MLGPNSFERPHAFRSFDIAYDTNDNYWRSLQDSDCLDDLFLIHFRTRFVDLANDVRHTGLVGKEGGQVDRLRWVILWEGLYLTTMTLGALLWGETHVPMSGGRKLTVRLERDILILLVLLIYFDIRAQSWVRTYHSCI